MANDAGASRAQEEWTRRAAALEAEVESLRDALHDASDDRARLVATHEAERAAMQDQMRRIAAVHAEATEAAARWKRRVFVALTLGGAAAAALFYGAAAGAQEDVAEGVAPAAHPSAAGGSTRGPVAAVGRLTYAGPFGHWRGEPSTLQARGGAA